MEVRCESGAPSPAKIQTPRPATPYQIPAPSLLDTLAVIGGCSSGSSSAPEDERDRSETSTSKGDSGFSELEAASPDSDHPDSLSRLEEQEDDDDDEDDDVSSTISDLSGMSDMSSLEWRSSGPLGWIQRQMHMGADPRHVLAKIVSEESVAAIPQSTDDLSLWKMLIKIMTTMQWRKKLPYINTLSDVLSLIRQSKRILVLTGAGVSVSCGIPDFRSPTGVYARLARDFPDLPDPHAMFDIRYFNNDPRPFFKFAREIYPGQFQPSPCHKFIRALETHGKLLRNYSQNIDTLEQVAGIKRVVQCHGSFATATCTHCKRKVEADTIRDDILSQRIPVCQICVPEGAQQALLDLANDYSGVVARGVMKPDIVFFGEGLPKNFHEAVMQDKDQADLLLIIGSSLKVQPVALIPSSIPESVPQVLINREPLPDCKVDVELLGDADVLVDHICRELGEDWAELCWRDTPLTLAELPSIATSVAAKDVELTCDDVSPSTSTSCNKVPECSRKRTGSSEAHEPVKKSRTNDLVNPSNSLSVEDETDVATARSCEALVEEEEAEWRDARQIKLRQMSSDSTRDSGIAEPSDERLPPPPPHNPYIHIPENSYIFQAPNRYLFPGAEASLMRRHDSLSSICDSDLGDVSAPSSPSRDSTPPPSL